LKDEISKLLIDEYVKNVYPYVYEMHNTVELCEYCQCDPCDCHGGPNE